MPTPDICMICGVTLGEHDDVTDHRFDERGTVLSNPRMAQTLRQVMRETMAGQWGTRHDRARGALRRGLVYLMHECLSRTGSFVQLEFCHAISHPVYRSAPRRGREAMDALANAKTTDVPPYWWSLASDAFYFTAQILEQQAEGFDRSDDGSIVDRFMGDSAARTGV